MCFTLYALFLYVCMAKMEYTLVDPRQNNTSLCPLGSLQISNGLLDDTLTFLFNFTTRQCNRSLIAIQSVNMSITLLQEESSNVLFFLSMHVDNNGTAIMQLPGINTQCMQTLHFVFAIDVSTVTQKITLVASQENSISINCTLLPVAIGFNCQSTPFIQSINYQLTNCLVTSDTSVLLQPPLPREIHSPLYWYAQYLMNTSRIRRNANNVTLCGEPLHTILYRSDHYLSRCDPDRFDSRHTRSAWYRMAIQVVTVVCNDIPEQYQWIWLHAVEILERHCDERESGLSEEAAQDNSLFMVISNRLDEANLFNVKQNGGENEIELCEEIRSYFESTYNETMSKMLYNQWFYKAFHSILWPDINMKPYSILLVIIFSLIPFLLCCLFAKTIYQLKNFGTSEAFKRKKKNFV